MTQNETDDQANLRRAYFYVFALGEGKMVLRDLIRVSNLTRINSDDPNSNAALYKVAQQDLIRRIEKMSNVRINED